AVTNAIATLSLHGALPIWRGSWPSTSTTSCSSMVPRSSARCRVTGARGWPSYERERADEFERLGAGVRAPRSTLAQLGALAVGADRKSTRLNSSHVKSSYA